MQSGAPNQVVTPARFSSDQRGLVFEALHDAEREISRYYCIPPHRWQGIPYDLLLQDDQGWQLLPEHVLANLVRLHRTLAGPAATGPPDFFRIQLHDARILSAAARERMGRDLYPLLLYILTHELVHLVRLSSILDQEEERYLSPEREEGRVRRICHQILSRARHPGVPPVMERFRL